VERTVKERHDVVKVAAASEVLVQQLFGRSLLQDANSVIAYESSDVFIFMPE